MADAITKQFEIKPELIKGSGGIFDVKIGGQLIYSKAETGCFPEHEDICKSLRKLQS